MHLSVKLAIATLMWTAAFALATFGTIDDAEDYGVWAILAGLVATTVSMWLALDLVIERSAKRAVELVQERQELMAEQVARKITGALQNGATVKSLR